MTTDRGVIAVNLGEISRWRRLENFFSRLLSLQQTFATLPLIAITAWQLVGKTEHFWFALLADVISRDVNANVEYESFVSSYRTPIQLLIDYPDLWFGFAAVYLTSIFPILLMLLLVAVERRLLRKRHSWVAWLNALVAGIAVLQILLTLPALANAVTGTPLLFESMFEPTGLPGFAIGIFADTVLAAACVLGVLTLIAAMRAAFAAVEIRKFETQSGLAVPLAMGPETRSMPPFPLGKRLAIGCLAGFSGLLVALSFGFLTMTLPAMALQTTVAASCTIYNEHSPGALSTFPSLGGDAEPGWLDRISDALSRFMTDGPCVGNHVILVLLLAVIALPLFAILFGLGGGAKFWSRLLMRQSAIELLGRDKRAPIVFLRPFSNDGVATRPNSIDWVQSVAETGSSRSSVDHILLEEATAFGPVVALGNPRDKHQPTGVARSYQSDEVWQRVAEDLIGRSAYVILAHDNTPNMVWEFDKLIASNRTDDTLLIAPLTWKASDAEKAAVISRFFGVEVAAQNSRNILGAFKGPAGVVLLCDAEGQEIEYATAVATFLSTRARVRGVV